MKTTSVWREAKRLLDNPKVATRIEKLQAEDAKAYKVTRVSLARELDAVIISASREKKYGAVVSALDKKAKLFGLYEKQNEQNEYQFDLSTKLHPILQEMMDYSHDSPDYIQRLRQEP